MRDYILELISMKDIINKYGFHMKHNMIRCPFHNDKTASMKIYDKSFYCFGCNKTGDLIQFVEYLFNLNFKEAMQKINLDFNLNLSSNIKIDYNKIKSIQEEKQRKEKQKNIIFQQKCDILLSYNRYIKYFSKRINKNNWENYTHIIAFLKDKAEMLEFELDNMY